MLKGCSPKCFEVYTDSCVEYTGPTFTEIGIVQGDSIQNVITELASTLATLKARVDACSFCNGESIVKTTDELVNTSSLTYSSITELPINSRFVVKSTPSQTSTYVSYDIRQLPADAVTINSETWVEGMKNGYPSKIVETKGLAGGFELSPDNFPAKLFTKTRMMTSSGEREITASIPLDPSGQATDVNMYSREIGADILSSQTDVNKFFDKELSNLRSAISGLQNVNTNGTQTPITDKIIELEQRINAIT